MVSKNTAADRSLYVFIQDMNDPNANHPRCVYNEIKMQFFSVKM